MRPDRFARLAAVHGPVCHYCAVRLTSVLATRDHIVARSRGGRGNAGNIVLACLDCQGAKADGDYAVFIASAWLAARRADVVAGATARVPNRPRTRPRRLARPAAPAASSPAIRWSCRHRRGSNTMCSTCAGIRHGRLRTLSNV